MPTLAIMVGLPASGKSTFAKERLLSEHSYLYISRDAIREALCPGDFSFAKEKEVLRELISQMLYGLRTRQDVIIDATNLTPKARRRLFSNLDSAELENVEIQIYSFDVSVPRCLEQNEKRQGREKVPPKVILEMSERYILPEYNEDERITSIFRIAENGRIRLLVKEE